jgi:hypothetical protein
MPSSRPPSWCRRLNSGWQPSIPSLAGIDNVRREVADLAAIIAEHAPADTSP